MMISPRELPNIYKRSSRTEPRDIKMFTGQEDEERRKEGKLECVSK